MSAAVGFRGGAGALSTRVERLSSPVRLVRGDTLTAEFVKTRSTSVCLPVIEDVGGGEVRVQEVLVFEWGDLVLPVAHTRRLL